MNEQELYAMRHSLAHITAQAVQRLYKNPKFGIGPVIKNGFYYDIDLGDEQISESDFKKIEKEMHKIIKQDYVFEKELKDIDEALEWADKTEQTYKRELLNDLKRSGTTLASELDSDMIGVDSIGESEVKNVSFYTDGDFTDLCRGPHVESTKKVGVFKLMKVAGAYWRGDENKPMMQRLYGVAFATKEELKDYLTKLEEAKKRDHRKLGKELDLYTISDLVGSGLPLLTPRGAVLRQKLLDYSMQLQQDDDYQAVCTPHIAKIDLYKTSGHAEKYPERFTASSIESDDEFMIKPMNCPHHIEIFARKPVSYKELPVRFMEAGVVYRDEKRGELHGLSRVRGMTVDDRHNFCAKEGIQEEINKIVKNVQSFYGVVGLNLKARLSYRDDSDSYLGSDEVWNLSQDAILQAAKNNSLEYYEEKGEAAFYGPKIDFMIGDSLGREWQLSTLQIDFVLAERFGATFINEKGEKEYPAILHSATLGSVERFMSIFIEDTAGKFPYWIAPEQIRVLTVNDEVEEYAKKVADVLNDCVLDYPLRNNKVRYGLDRRDVGLGKKIREAAKMKIPVQIIVGSKDMDHETVSLRVSNEEKTICLSELKEFVLEFGK